MSRFEREYLFFRHAQAENQDPVFEGAVVRDSAGRADYPLSRAGREQAARAGEEARAFGAELLLCSSLRRARETAAIVGRETNLEIFAADPDFDEVNPGRSSLRSFSFAKRELALVSLSLAAAVLFDRRAASLRAGESAPELLARIRRAFARLDALEASRVVIVSHGYWIFTAALLVSPALALQRARMFQHCASIRIARDSSGKLRLLAQG